MQGSRGWGLGLSDWIGLLGPFIASAICRTWVSILNEKLESAEAVMKVDMWLCRLQNPERVVKLLMLKNSVALWDNQDLPKFLYEGAYS